MHFAIILIIAALASNGQCMQCPDGSPVYEVGISDQGKDDVIRATNEKRQMVLDGNVPGQPQGRDIVMTEFDDDLAAEGRVVSETCEMNHILAQDDRWSWVGQNLYISWSSAQSSGQDWDSAVESWFSEHKNFIYPNSSTGTVGHYTQLVWHNSELVGCDFISFYDSKKPQYPYAKLYTCNYGPGGNYNGEAPYPLA